MGPLDYQEFYHRNLPHFQPLGAMLFVTFRLAGSLPVTILQELSEKAKRDKAGLERLAGAPERMERNHREQRRLFGQLDQALDQATSGPCWLRDPKVAALVAESLHYLDGRMVDLLVFCLMPNHVHVVLTPLLQDETEYYALSRIMHSLKGYTAGRANRLLGRTGAFWHHESYDHVVRNAAELERIVAYVLNNPVKAGLVEDWREWRWTYCKNTP
jgi:putative transposase